MVERMNKTLVGQPGIVTGTTDENRPMYVGDFISAERDKNLLIRFSKELVLLFEPIMVLSVVGEKNADGSLPCKVLCEELYIGDRTLREIILDEVEEKLPPEPPTVHGLVREHGTFTVCEEMTKKFVDDGLIRKEGSVLHVSMNISDTPGCICGITNCVENLESLIRDLLKHFDADEIVFHHTTRTAEMIATPEVEAGYEGDLRYVPGYYKEDGLCGTYPIIKGIKMHWEPLTKENA